MFSTMDRQFPKCLSGSTLKLIAIFTMLIDHIGAAFLAFYLREQSFTTDGRLQLHQLQLLYEILRGIGRIAFPIFCFLLVEGFLHTKNMKKYVMRLAYFCVLSEIPFNLAFSHRISYPAHQNVFFTLLIGLLVLIVFREISTRLAIGFTQTFLLFLTVIAGCNAANILHTDYGATGVLTIVLFYVLHKTPVWATVAACSVLTLHNQTEIYTFILVFLLPLYNGKRGLNLKYIFYMFYPLHLLLLYQLCQILLGSNA